MKKEGAVFKWMADGNKKAVVNSQKMKNPKAKKKKKQIFRKFQKHDVYNKSSTFSSFNNW